MATESNRHENDEDPLEQTELARRLRRMEWPPAPAEVRERVLSRIVAHTRQTPGADEGGDSPSEPSHD